MNRTLQILCIGLLSVSFLSACEKEEAAVEEPVAVEEPLEEEAELVEDTEEELGEVAAEEGPDEGMFIRAAYEVTCVRAKIEDPTEQNAILAEVYPRYGFTPETFAAMESELAEQETVKIAITERMKDCTVELAEGFRTAGAADAVAVVPAADGAAAPAAKKAAGPSYKTGTLKDASVGGGGIEGGELTLRVGNDGEVVGTFRGQREGKGFSIPLRGNVAADGSLDATGSVGQNKVQVAGGRVTTKGASGSLTGQINQKDFKSTFTAQ